jgi:ribonuclease BN (tRNA processing enzyme)
MNLDISDLDTILLTHLHIDHTADVPSFLKARAMTQSQPIEFTISRFLSGSIARKSRERFGL